MNFAVRVFLKWLPLGIGLTLLCGVVYVAVQQQYRQSANDPQIQMAEDAASALSTGTPPNQVIRTSAAVDITTSLSPWLAIYTEDGVGIISTGEANGAVPVMPQGVFATSTWKRYAEDGIAMRVPHTETRFTWQSGAGVRQALVMVHFSSPKDSGFVVAGRNLTEVENRVGALTGMVALAWAVAILLTLIAQAVVQYLL